MTHTQDSGEAHTAGPWEYRPEPHDDWGVVRAGRYWIGQIKDSRYLDEEYLAQCRRERRDPWEANARLVSAAPDLLRVAQMVVEASDLCGFSGPLGDAARLAVAKACPRATLGTEGDEA